MLFDFSFFLADNCRKFVCFCYVTSFQFNSISTVFRTFIGLYLFTGLISKKTLLREIMLWRGLRIECSADKEQIHKQDIRIN